MFFSVSVKHIYLSLLAVLSDRSLKAARKSKLSRLSAGFNTVEEVSEVHRYRWGKN